MEQGPSPFRIGTPLALIILFPHDQTTLKGLPMSKHQNNLVCLKDMLEHLTDCRQQLDWVEEEDGVRVLTESMLRDLDCCRRLCETIQRRASRLAPAL